MRLRREDKRRGSGSFLVGCDGIRSAVRNLLLKERGIEELEPVFTDLVQVAGISRAPEAVRGQKQAMRNFYRAEKYFSTFPSFCVKDGMTGWAITSRSLTPNVETWQSMDDK